MRFLGFAGLGVGVVLLSACSGPAQPSDAAQSAHDAIYGGSLDTSDNAIGALLTFGSTGTSECSGTVIASKGRTGFYLTAAHCVVNFDPQTMAPAMPVSLADPTTMELVMGSDYNAPTAAYGVLDATVPAQYDGNVVNDYDVAIVRFAGYVSSIPVIQPMSAAQDSAAGFGAGSSVKIIGYGLTDGMTNNSLRNTVQKSIQKVQSQDLVYDQSNGQGLCEGDSGGPALFTTSSGVRVAGVNSWVQGFQGTDPCMFQGASVRVSFHEQFISNVFNSAPAQLDCQSCELASIGSGNACASISNECSSASSTACGQYSACVDGCSTQACKTACSTSQAAGFARYNQYISCVCNDCSTECQGAPACPSTGSGGSGGVSGAGGTSGGVSGSGGTGTSGASAGGVGGSSGSSASGGTGTSGGSGSSGGDASGGLGATAGASGSGTAGSAGTLAGGSSSGGAAGSSGSSGSGGSDLAPATPASTSKSNVTCKCSVPGVSAGLDVRAYAGLIGLGLVLSRRRVSRRTKTSHRSSR